jgi:hypothetical protein
MNILQHSANMTAIQGEVFRLESVVLAQKAKIETDLLFKERLLALSSIASLRAEEIANREH